MNFAWIRIINQKIRSIKFRNKREVVNRRQRAIARKNRKVQMKKQLDNEREARIQAGVIQLKQQLFALTLTDEQKRNFVLNVQRLNAERFLKDNERIWSVSTLFIPLSLAGLSSLRDKEFTIILLLGAGSIALISFWYLASEKLRRFQDENLDMITIFNIYLGFDTRVIKVKVNYPEKEKKQNNLYFLESLESWREAYLNFLRDTTIQEARLYIFQFIIVIWLLAIFWYGFYGLFTIANQSAGQIKFYLWEVIIFLFSPLLC